MFYDTPLEEPFRVIVWLVIGIPLLLLIIAVMVPIVGFVIGIKVTLVLFSWAIVLAVLGYVAGIPWAIWFRATKGYWPSGGT